MDQVLTQEEPMSEALEASLRQACKKIAPVWPLENFVAVNPYLGLADKTFNEVAQELTVAGDVQMTLPISFYLEKIEEGKISSADLAEVLYKRQYDSSVEGFLKTVASKEPISLEQVSTVADIAAKVTGKDWSRFVVGRITVWAASYFDHGQAAWTASHSDESPFSAWKSESLLDRTPEVAGLKGFRNAIKSLPDNPLEAAQDSIARLNLPEESLALYLHSLLLRVGGWSAHAARLDWDNELHGGEDGKLIEFLAILVSWEALLLQCLPHSELKGKWRDAAKNLAQSSTKMGIEHRLAQKLILQEAFDLASQRSIVSKFKEQEKIEEKDTQPKAQAVFCIDVRSEVFRRNLELVDGGIETFGFAGFFAFPIKYVPIGHEDGEAQCPVLLTTGPTIVEEIPEKGANAHVFEKRILNRQVQKIWKTFRAGAITCFSFVSPIGLAYLPKLFTDSFGLTRPVPNPDKVGLSSNSIGQKSISLIEGTRNKETTGIPLEDQIQMAKNALKAMSLADNFAQFVMITGHGSTTVNNPYATGLDCGACGGHTGEANARVAAEVLNNKEVRIGLSKEGIDIPENTVFLACLHDTTTDDVLIFNEKEVPTSLSEELTDLQKTLRLAGHAARTERSLRMTVKEGANIDSSIIGRSKDWSQTRPEWGLAGCSAFVVAPRERTKGIDFGGRSFLHSYEWKNDTDFSILELIMTAPMVVTSWISLQYFASTVDNKNFGSGNKTLHNVTAGIGVLEGYSGDLRVGLPMQSVHDGVNYQHEPIKLNVIIEAPTSAMNAILENHEPVRNLCDNGWLNLLAMSEEGQVSHRYVGGYTWEQVH